jgi:hypothetical protein
MKKVLIGLVLLVLSAEAVPPPALSVDTWYVDSWSGGVGATLTDGGGYTAIDGTVLLDPGPAPWTFSGPVTLVVQDLFFDGDQFQVFDNGVPIGTSSVPANDGANCGNDPVGCTDPKWSRGVFPLGAGSHSITFKLVAQASGYPSGEAAFEFSNGTPHFTPGPPSFLLVVLGCLGLAIGCRVFRRQRAMARFS